MKKIFSLVLSLVFVLILAFPSFAALPLPEDAPSGGEVITIMNTKLYTPYEFSDDIVTPWYSAGHEFTESDPYFFYLYLKAAGLVGQGRVTEQRINEFCNIPVVDAGLQGVFLRLCDLIYYACYNSYEGSDASCRIYIGDRYMPYLEQFIDMYCEYYSIEGEYDFGFKSYQYSDTWYNSPNVIYLYLVPDKSVPTPYRFNMESAELLPFEDYAQFESTNLVSWWDSFVKSIDISQLTSWIPAVISVQIVAVFISFLSLIVLLIILKTLHG